MAGKTTRLMITIPAEMIQRAEALKQDAFYDKSYAEMYRQLIQLGMNKIQEKEEGGE